MQPWKCHRGACYSRDERDLLSSRNMHVTSINCSGSWDFQSKPSKNKRQVLSLWSQLQFCHGAQWGKISKVKLNYLKVFQGHSYTSQWNLVQRDLTIFNPASCGSYRAACPKQLSGTGIAWEEAAPVTRTPSCCSQDSCPNPCRTTAPGAAWGPPSHQMHSPGHFPTLDTVKTPWRKNTIIIMLLYQLKNVSVYWYQMNMTSKFSQLGWMTRRPKPVKGRKGSQWLSASSTSPISIHMQHIHCHYKHCNNSVSTIFFR